MRTFPMVVAVVMIACSSFCRCDFADSIPALQQLIGLLDQAQSLKSELGITSLKSSLLSPENLQSPSALPLSSRNFLDILPAQQATADPGVNELTSNLASTVKQVADQISAGNSAAAQSELAAEQVAAANNAAAAQSQAEQAAQAAQFSSSPAVTHCSLTNQDGMIFPELPLPILAHLMPCVSQLQPHILAQLPTSILSQLSPDVLEKLPPSVLRTLSEEALAKLSLQTLSSLPSSVLSKLPFSLLSQLPVEVLEKLSTDVLAKLPLTVLAGLPQALLSRMVQDIVRKLPLPLETLYQLTNLKQLATPGAISNLLRIIDVFKKISGSKQS